MAFTYDLENADATAVTRSRARRLASDVDAANALFTDAEWDAFLAMNVGIKRAAAAALDVVAADLAMVMRVMKSGDDSTDGRATADAVRKQAQALRDQADRDDDDSADSGSVSIIDFNPYAGWC